MLKTAIRKLSNLFSRFRRHKQTIKQIPINLNNRTAGHDIFQALDFDEEQFQDLSKFNSYYEVPEFFQRWMLRDVVVRTGLIFLKSSLNDRPWILKGNTIPQVKAFHGAWIERLLPQLMEKAAWAVYYGWVPMVVDYEYKSRWPYESEDRLEEAVVPWVAHDVSSFTTEPLLDDRGQLEGLHTNGSDLLGLYVDQDPAFWPRERSLYLNWFEEQGSPFGNGQNGVIFPYWLLSSMLRLWAAKNGETNLQGRYAAFCEKGLVEMFGGDVEQLSTVVGEALSQLKNGGWATLPAKIDPATGKNAVWLEPIETEDRMESFLKYLAWCDRMRLLGVLCLPGIGFDADKGATFSEGRTATQTQRSVLEEIGNIVLTALNRPGGLIETVHRLNGLPGDPPWIKGRPYSRDQEEMFRSIAVSLLTQKLAYVGPDGKFKNEFYIGGECVDLESLISQLGVPTFSTKLFARKNVEQPPGAGGRPQEPGVRQDDRDAGLDR